MKLCELMKVYNGNACISIDGYCEEESYSYYTLPNEDEEDFKGENQNSYIPSCLELEPWYRDIKDKEVSRVSIIGGGMYKVEMRIELE